MKVYGMNFWQGESMFDTLYIEQRREGEANWIEWDLGIKGRGAFGRYLKVLKPNNGGGVTVGNVAHILGHDTRAFDAPRRSLPDK